MPPNRLLTVCWPAALVVVLAMITASPANANPRVRKQVAAKTRAAMEAYDLLEYEEAKKGLSEALVLAKRNRLGNHKSTAEVHVYLGILHFSGFEDKESAMLEFLSALEIDPEVRLPKAYRTKEMDTLFDSARQELESSGGDNDDSVEAPASAGPTAEQCGAVKKLKHDLIEGAPRGQSLDVQLLLGSRVKAARVLLHYRPPGKKKFIEVLMTKNGECGYVGTIPSTDIRGEIVHYYVSAVNKKGKVLASKGSAGSPNLMEVTAPVAGSAGDGENPFVETGAEEDPISDSSASDDDDGDMKDDEAERGRGKIFVNVAGGTGGGYVTGMTEAEDVKVECCFAPAIFHVLPEIGYFITNTIGLSAAFRLGFPVGANVPGHATAAPAGFARLRYVPGGRGDPSGVMVNVLAGAGIIRHTVKISNGTAGMDTDTTATGPVFLGAGLGYAKGLSGALRFIAEANAIMGMTAGMTELGTCPGNGCVRPHFGVQLDLNLGLMFAF